MSILQPILNRGRGLMYARFEPNPPFLTYQAMAAGRIKR